MKDSYFIHFLFSLILVFFTKKTWSAVVILVLFLYNYDYSVFLGKHADSVRKRNIEQVNRLI